MSKSLEYILNFVYECGYSNGATDWYEGESYGYESALPEMTVEEATKEIIEQRQKDLQAISYHFAIPVKDLEKVLDTHYDDLACLYTDSHYYIYCSKGHNDFSKCILKGFREDRL